MQVAIQISKLNDFIFCPNSLYLHSIYESFSDDTYKQKPQVVGKIRHENIDNAYYSSSSRYLQGIPVYCEKYNLVGKIDIYDSKEKILVDRKYRVKQIFDGYKYQLYAQYFSMIEKGYEVKNLFIHSLSDNRRYEIGLPNKEEIKRFEDLIKKIWKFYENQEEFDVNASKCANCIYNTLCHYAKSA
jgi:CRISPR-associated protein Cas4